jgi:hypothetical protein
MKNKGESTRRTYSLQQQLLVYSKQHTADCLLSSCAALPVDYLRNRLPADVYFL